MDPDANLTEARRVARRVVDNEAPRPEDVERLAELFTAMDEWLTRGGALPRAWASALDQKKE